MRLHVLLHLLGRTGAAAGGVAVPAAAAGVHGAHQHEAAGQRQGAGGAGDGHKAVLQRLAQRLQRRLAELRQLVQKQHAVVGQGYLSRPGYPPAAGERHGGRRVVGAAEGARIHQRVRAGRSCPPRSRSPWSAGPPRGSCPAGWTAAAGPAWTCPRRGSPPAAHCGRRRRRSPAPASHSPAPSRRQNPAGAGS